MEAVLTMQSRPTGNRYVSLLFMQVFILDAVECSLGWVDHSITQMLYWRVARVVGLHNYIGKQAVNPAEKRVMVGDKDHVMPQHVDVSERMGINEKCSEGYHHITKVVCM